MKRPENSTFSEDDWNALSKMWLAVAYSDEITADKPFGTTLLDVKLVLYRSKDGNIIVAPDKCPHRGGSLSRGEITNGNLACPYHGFQYGNGGECKIIPAYPDIKISKKLNLTTLPVVERYNIVWTSFVQEPINPLPDFKELEDPDAEVFKIPLLDQIGVSAARYCENFHDPAHFPFVHRATFGSYDDPDVPQFKVEREKFTMKHEYVLDQIERTTFNEEQEGNVASMGYEYRFTFPFGPSLVMTSRDNPDFGWYTIQSTAQPITATSCRIFLQQARSKNDNPVETVEDIIKFQQQINMEDKSVVEYLDPLELSLDMTDQVLIPSDTWSVNYRRGLAELGLTTGINDKV